VDRGRFRGGEGGEGEVEMSVTHFESEFGWMVEGGGDEEEEFCGQCC